MRIYILNAVALAVMLPAQSVNGQTVDLDDQRHHQPD